MKAILTTTALTLLRPVYFATPTGTAIVVGLFTLAVTFAACHLTWRAIK